ncbi:MAG: hypothetical protein FJX52_06900 [Alphaproteobacteria bacterium]|nr:hypothetical protein [Alphaproteobacteria bacterium]
MLAPMLSPPSFAADQVKTHPVRFGSSAATRELGPPIDRTKRPRDVFVFEPDGFMVQQTNLPYWEVGNLERKLTVLCSSGRFNQIDTHRLTIGFNGLVGGAVLGIARGDGWNLYDPTRAAKREDTYYFHRDRTGNCTVFSWNAQERRRRQGSVVYPTGHIRETYDAAYTRPDK